MTLSMLVVTGLLWEWIALAIVVERGLCSNSGHCYALPDPVGTRVAWGVVAAAVSVVGSLFFAAALLVWRRRLEPRVVRWSLFAASAACVALAFILYSLSNVYYDGGEPYRSGDADVRLAVVPLLSAVAAAGLAAFVPPIGADA